MEAEAAVENLFEAAEVEVEEPVEFRLEAGGQRPEPVEFPHDDDGGDPEAVRLREVGRPPAEQRDRTGRGEVRVRGGHGRLRMEVAICS